MICCLASRSAIISHAAEKARDEAISLLPTYIKLVNFIHDLTLQDVVAEEVAHASLYVMLVASKLTFHRKYGRSSIRLLVLLGDFKPLWTARTDRESSKP